MNVRHVISVSGGKDSTATLLADAMLEESYR